MHAARIVCRSVQRVLFAVLGLQRCCSCDIVIHVLETHGPMQGLMAVPGAEACICEQAQSKGMQVLGHCVWTGVHDRENGVNCVSNSGWDCLSSRYALPSFVESLLVLFAAPSSRYPCLMKI